MRKKAIYPGTFDPITLGHVDIVQRSAQIFDKIYLAVADSSAKQTLFDAEQRSQLAKQALADLDNVEVVVYNKLLVDCMREHKATVILRGLRSSIDFEYEKELATMNRHLLSEAETLFISADPRYSHISSSLVREISQLDGDVCELVTANVLAALQKKNG